MALEEPYIRHLLEDGAVVLGGRLYKPSGNEQAMEGDAVLAIGARSLKLERLALAFDIERAYFEDPVVSEQMQEMQMKLLKKYSSQLGTKVKDLFIEQELLAFISEEVLPYFATSGDELARIAGRRLQPAKEKKSSKGLRALGVRPTRQRPAPLREASLLEDTLAELSLGDVCTARAGGGTLVYSLALTDAPSGPSVSVGGRNYSLVYRMPFEKFAQAYNQRLARKLQQDALAGEEGAADALSEKRTLEQRVRESVSKVQDLRVERLGPDKYLLTLGVPQFANRGEDGGIYVFPPCEVSVALYAVRVQPGKPCDIRYVKPFVKGAYLHPFVQHHRKLEQGIIEENKSICLDDDLEKDRSRWATARLESMSLGQKVAGYLMLGRDILVTGYKLEGSPGKYKLLNRPRSAFVYDRQAYLPLKKDEKWLREHGMVVSNTQEEV